MITPAQPHELQAVLRQTVIMHAFNAISLGPRRDPVRLQRQGDLHGLAIGERPFHQHLMRPGTDPQPQKPVAVAQQSRGRVAVKQDAPGQPLPGSARKGHGGRRRGVDLQTGAQDQRSGFQSQARYGRAVRTAFGGRQEARAQLVQQIGRRDLRGARRRPRGAGQ